MIILFLYCEGDNYWTKLQMKFLLYVWLALLYVHSVFQKRKGKFLRRTIQADVKIEKLIEITK